MRYQAIKLSRVSNIIRRRDESEEEWETRRNREIDKRGMNII